MSTTTVRINYQTWEHLKELAAFAGESMQDTLDKAIEEYRRKCFLEQANKAFAALKNKPDEWAEEVNERGTWDITNNDGLRKE